ncbi:hypothetical protein BH708_08585 [Brachybacterium sp. P6-10-X1]|uniref:cell division protein PerM n=1 Tax=Brachybacterium sp. P6-10-X1 TaxID=1903186 RepID=UPI000971888C|nr:DUF6350 family protein [Brachybacterium sp. P6-10-X1]APX32766.1 hypothetical protein BH708_08585 [Brachybacterium sp. P6-10-X1]
MSSTGDSIATPLVRGALAAALSLGTALAVVVVPALAAQVAGTRSTASVLDAIIIALNVLVLGHGGGIILSTGVIDGSVTLTPFGLLALLLVLAALGMRRVGRALRLVRDDGVLRLRALRDAGGALGSYAVVYAIGVGVLAGIGRSIDTSPVVTSAFVSGAMVAVLGGLTGLLWSLRREATSTVPGVRVLDLLPSPYGDVARAALIALLGLLCVGLGTTVVMLLVSVPAQSSLFESLDPGVTGGLVLTLVQLALLPLLAVWALVVVAGGTVGLGTTTELSLGGSETGVMPALPMLGAIPGPGDFPGWTWVLLVLPVIPIALGAVRLVRDVADLERRDRITAWIAYPAVVVVAVLLLAGLSTGGIGEGRLVHLGPQMGSFLLPLVGLAVLATGGVIGVLATPLLPWARTSMTSLRARVDRAETSERAPSETRSGPTLPAPPRPAPPSSAGSSTSPASASSAASAAEPASSATPGSPGTPADSPVSAGSPGYVGSPISARSPASAEDAVLDGEVVNGQDATDASTDHERDAEGEDGINRPAES